MASQPASGSDPTLYLYTSLTAGSSHIITATSRMETILKANKVAFRAIDCATDEKARNLWSRRSKGRKIPGLVKYGQVVGDLKEVEEWNEYGELKENIENVSDLLGDTPMTDTPMPPPAPITLKDPLAKVSEPPSRSSSETRHISISEPKDRDREGSPSAASSARNSKDGSPISIAMRQAGVEAAAKAGQMKASAASSLKSSSAASAIPSKRDSTDTTPNVAAMKSSIDTEDPARDPEITDAKTPSQLATEGAKNLNVDRTADTSGSSATSPVSADGTSKSNEEQLLEARRHSSVAKVPSRLQQETSIDEVRTPGLEEAVSSSDKGDSDDQPTHYRGRSLSTASKQEIERFEKQHAIKEESEESEDDSDDDEAAPATDKSASKTTIGATDAAEAAVMKGSKTQDQKTKDADAAGVSVGD